MKKKTRIICAAVIALAVTVAAAVIIIRYINRGYEDRIFDTSYVHTIDIEISQEDWEDLQENALEKTKYKASVTIDGETFDNVALSAKGAHSLRTIAESPDKIRYSLKLRFDKYDKDQTYYGLDIMDLGNSVDDPSLVKNYISYYMFRDMGVSTPCISYADVTVNGQLYGIFTVTEELDESYLERNYDGEGNLYKPESEELSNENSRQNEDITAAIDSDSLDELNLVHKPLDEYSADSPGADLVYTGDDPENYSDIFDNNVTDTDDEDMERVVAALKNLSEGNAQAAVDTDEVIMYFAVHNFTNNYDSYTGGLNHNYYLYEKDGKLQMLPWDYDFSNALTTDERAAGLAYKPFYTVESDIDAPLFYSEDSRPMWSFIANDETYLTQYHSEMDRLLKKDLESGKAVKECRRIVDMIRDHVAADPTYGHTIEEYDAAADDVIDFLQQRAQSVRAQLDDKDK